MMQRTQSDNLFSCDGPTICNIDSVTVQKLEPVLNRTHYEEIDSDSGQWEASVDYKHAVTETAISINRIPVRVLCFFKGKSCLRDAVQACRMKIN
jgi:hypothetical protein